MLSPIGAVTCRHQCDFECWEVTQGIIRCPRVQRTAGVLETLLVGADKVSPLAVEDIVEGIISKTAGAVSRGAYPANVKQMKKIFLDICGARPVPGYEYGKIVIDRWFSSYRLQHSDGYQGYDNKVPG